MGIKYDVKYGITEGIKCKSNMIKFKSQYIAKTSRCDQEMRLKSK